MLIYPPLGRPYVDPLNIDVVVKYIYRERKILKKCYRCLEGMISIKQESFLKYFVSFSGTFQIGTRKGGLT